GSSPSRTGRGRCDIPAAWRCTARAVDTASRCNASGRAALGRLARRGDRVVIMDGEVPWQFDTEPGDEPGEPVPDGQFALIEAELTDGLDRLGGSGNWDGPVEPVDWRTLTAAQAEAQWRALDEFVTWLRTTYGLPPTV